MPMLQCRIRDELCPLEDEYAAHQKAMTCLLDRMIHEKGLGKRERTKLSRWIADTAFELLEFDQDPLLKEMYNRHSGRDLDEDEEEEAADMKLMMERLFGVELDAGLDLRSPKAVMEALHDTIEREADDAEPAPPREERRPTARAIAQEKREAAEAAQLKQTVRDIFRKLASALHPDREADPAERARKTALMQRVNVAYAADDLLGLLSLQLEIEQIDQGGLDSLDDEHIKRFNKILNGQIRELEREISSIEHMMGMSIPATTMGRVTPQSLVKTIDAEVARMRKQNKAMVAELDALRDVPQLKAWLKKISAASGAR